MNDGNRYRVLGVELSPFSVKVRSWFRYKGIPHEWTGRMLGPDDKKYTKVPLVPVVVTPTGEGLQDSTPIIERLEKEHPEPSIHPEEPVAAFVSAMLEEFGDEWGNKWMFHTRWARDVDQLFAATRLSLLVKPDMDEAAHVVARDATRERMTGRVWFVGSNETTGPQIEASLHEAIGILDAHLTGRPYLFGGRPSFGDFGLAAQIYESSLDPTPGAWIGSRTPRVLDWVQRMLWPRIEGDFERWADLEPTLMPLLKRQVGALFLPWSVANSQALAAGKEECKVELAGRIWRQKPQKYHAKSLQALRARYQEARSEAVDAVLERAGCRRFLAEGA